MAIVRGVDPAISSSLKCGILYLKFFSNVFFPLITLLFFSILSLNTFPPTIAGLILSSISLILIHAIYPSLNYIASTRSIGYVSIFFPFAALYLYHFNNYISASASSSIYINSTIFSSLLNLSPYLFALFFFISVCFVFLSSQQGSQFTISLILSLLFLDLDFGTFALAIMASASFFMLQFPVFNYGQHISPI